MGPGARWEEFEAATPDLAEGGRRLLLQHGLGLGYLATIRPDGGPRLHPFCPILAEGGLWGFIGLSPKASDLRRDGRYAVHAFPAEEVDDEFCVDGTAIETTSPVTIAAVRAAYTAPIQGGDETLFEFRIERAPGDVRAPALVATAVHAVAGVNRALRPPRPAAPARWRRRAGAG